MLDDAQKLLQSVKGKELLLEERIEQAIRLAALVQKEANTQMTEKEQDFQSELARLVHDPFGRVFTTEMTDQAFRSQNNFRSASQISYLLKKYGIPQSYKGIKRLGMQALRLFGPGIFSLAIPMMKKMIREEAARVILPGASDELRLFLEKKNQEGVSTNINRLGEAILGEEEAQRRLNTYLEDLKRPEIECISVKISTLYSQINLLGWEETLDKLAKPLRELLRTASSAQFQRPDGTSIPKSINLDMEEYRDLALTVVLFKKVLSEPEFITSSLGIALQSYIPDSFAVQEELTQWALARRSRGGAPIKIRIVKGANLAMEKVESALRGWPQAPYDSKITVDMNYKRMVEYALMPSHAEAVHVGIGSHNLFDICYALVLTAERNLQPFVVLEMLEGMADFVRRTVQHLASDMLVYCPAATAAEFHNAIAYLIRRLDENTGAENFLRVSFGLVPNSAAWNEQASRFAYSCKHQNKAEVFPFRYQNRELEPIDLEEDAPFDNEADTDWTQEINREWIKNILNSWKDLPAIPAIIAGNTNDTLFEKWEGKNSLIASIGLDEVDLSLETAKKSFLTSPADRVHQLSRIASRLRKARGQLIAAMVSETAKPVPEADTEVSEAIDFAEYYARSLRSMESLKDVQYSPKGVIFIASPWNFPCSIPAGGLLAALAGGNSVIFKPAPEAALVGYELAKVFWASGVSKEQLQFVPCDDVTAGHYVQDKRINAVILTGSTSTARMLLEMRPGLDLMAETGGKNSLIVTAMADRDLAVKDVVQSAFGYAGQKCSACSLLILEEEIYEDPSFRKQLKDAVQSLTVGSPWNLSSKLNPLIRPPGNALQKAIDTLERGEEWLLEPKIDPNDQHLLTPGIKWGVLPGSFTHMNELFGPVLAVMKAKDLNHAIQIANQVPFGLTAGIHSLDTREHLQWLNDIDAGNCYINRGITGAIVERQPFGGIKDSSFGPGAKAGGPNYLFQMMHIEQIDMPLERASLPPSIEELLEELEKKGIDQDTHKLIEASARSYSFYWKHFFFKDHDPMHLLGQDNLQHYKPKSVEVRIGLDDAWEDLIRIAIASRITGAKLDISVDKQYTLPHVKLWGKIHRETEKQFIDRISKKKHVRVRLLKMPSKDLFKVLSNLGFWVAPSPVLANGRIELLRYLQEVSISYDYHRYGYLGARELEPRKHLPSNKNGQT